MSIDKLRGSYGSGKTSARKLRRQKRVAPVVGRFGSAVMFHTGPGDEGRQALLRGFIAEGLTGCITEKDFVDTGLLDDVPDDDH